jgi:hypothetical protein
MEELKEKGHAVTWWLRHCATSGEIVDTSLHEVNFIFHLALGFTEPVTDRSTRSRKIVLLLRKVRLVLRVETLTPLSGRGGLQG